MHLNLSINNLNVLAHVFDGYEWHMRSQNNIGFPALCNIHNSCTGRP